MQINSANLTPLGLSIAGAFDACRSMQAGAQVLQADYRAAMRDTVSRYNTGDPIRGIENGYVERVEASARTVVPSISASGGQVADSAPIPATPHCPDPSDDWHVAAACAPVAGDWHVRNRNSGVSMSESVSPGRRRAMAFAFVLLAIAASPALAHAQAVGGAGRHVPERAADRVVQSNALDHDRHPRHHPRRHRHAVDADLRGWQSARGVRGHRAMFNASTIISFRQT